LALVAGLAAVVAAEAVIVEFSFDPMDLVTQASIAPYGPAVGRELQDNPRRLHVEGRGVYGYPGDGGSGGSSIYFQSFQNDTAPTQPWYGRGNYVDPVPTLVSTPGVDYFNQLWTDNATADNAGQIRLNYFNLWIPESTDGAGQAQVSDWGQSLVRMPGSSVVGEAGAGSGWDYGDLGGIDGPTFAKVASSVQTLDQYSLYRGSANPFGTFRFIVRTPQAINEGDEVIVWFGANGTEFLNFHYGGPNDPTPIQPNGNQPIKQIDDIRGFEGTMRLSAHIVPEPATVGMIVLGGLLLGASALRKRQGKALAFFLIAGAFVVSNAQAVTKQAPKLVRSDEPVHLVGLNGILEVRDAQGEVREVRALVDAPRIAPPALIHAKKGDAVLRAGEMYVELKEGGRLHLFKNTAAREIKFMVPKMSAAPATAYIEAKKLTIEPSQVLEASYDFIRQEVTVSRSVAAPSEVVEVAVLPPVTPMGTETIAFSAEKGAPVGILDTVFLPPVSPFLPPRAYPTK